jgi:hypothetical protein
VPKADSCTATTAAYSITSSAMARSVQSPRGWFSLSRICWQDALDAIKHDRLEIRPGLSNMLKTMSRIAPNFIVKQLGKSVDPMLKQAGN